MLLFDYRQHTIFNKFIFLYMHPGCHQYRYLCTCPLKKKCIPIPNVLPSLHCDRCIWHQKRIIWTRFCIMFSWHGTWIFAFVSSHRVFSIMHECKFKYLFIELWWNGTFKLLGKGFVCECNNGTYSFSFTVSKFTLFYIFKNNLNESVKILNWERPSSSAKELQELR